MRDTEVAEVRAALDDFVAGVFVSLPRVDQRAKGCLYLRGLMLDGRRKSMQPMGERLGVDYQQLQQFVSSSPWKVEPVRRQLAKLAVETIHPEAWVIDDTGFHPTTFCREPSADCCQTRTRARAKRTSSRATPAHSADCAGVMVGCVPPLWSRLARRLA